MRGRPLCVALCIVIIGILIGQLIPKTTKEPVYHGETHYLQGMVDQISGQGEQISLVVRDPVENGKSFCGQILVYGKEEKELLSEIKIGNIICMEGEVYSFFEPGNPGQFDELKYNKERGIDYKIYVQSIEVVSTSVKPIRQWLHEVRTTLYQAIQTCLPEEQAGVIAAMVLGEKCGLTKEMKQLYQENGIAHILAISGLHISLIGAGLFYVLRRYIMPMQAAVAVSSALLILYGELTGFSVSTQRAVIMMVCSLWAGFLGRRYDLLSALSLSALLALLFQPVLLFQTGFLLSYGTVAGIYLFVGKFTEGIGRKEKLLSAVAGTFGIQLVTLPILMHAYYEISLYSVLVNVIILPFLSILLSVSLAGGGLALLSLTGGRFLFGIVHYVLNGYQFICEVVNLLPFAQIITGCPSLWQIGIYYALLAVFCLLPQKEQRKKVIWLLPAAVLLLFFSPPEPYMLTITNLDVGQGDCACLSVGGKHILIDGGSSDVSDVGEYRISRYLKYQGIRRLDYIFMTHSDSDHVNGILQILEDAGQMGFEIGTIVLPDISNEDEAYVQIEQCTKKAGVRLLKMEQGDTLTVQEAVFSCLHPKRNYEWKKANDYSLVLQVKYRDFCGIFTGDLEQAGEEEILPQLQKVTYLKVGHHGSKTSGGEAFLDRLKPAVAVISSGEGNRYGHPAPETLERLHERGVRVYDTKETGAVTLKTDGEAVEVSAYKK